MVVIKADAYGHGAVRVAKTAINCGAYYLGVATIDEALELRLEGIDQNILILSQPPIDSIPLLVKYDIMPAVYDPEFAVKYAEEADKNSKLAKYHLAVNTGMNRIGIRYNNVLEFLSQVSFHRSLKLEGIFTHFATADCPDNLDFKKQYFNFVELINELKHNGINPGLVHAANSATIFRYPEAHFDMVRLGLSLYGYHTCNETRPIVNLKPVMSIHAKITDERILGFGEGVSYGMHYRARGATKICTLPIGYADGLRQTLSQKIDIIYKGQKFRQVGNICMDMCMFEIDMNSAIAQREFNAQVGEEVLLVGHQGESIITLDDLAKQAGTSTYEMACGFSRRMAVIYR